VIAEAKRRRRIAALEREILSDEEIRRLVRRGVLVPLSAAPHVPPRAEMMAELRARLLPCSGNYHCDRCGCRLCPERDPAFTRGPDQLDELFCARCIERSTT